MITIIRIRKVTPTLKTAIKHRYTHLDDNFKETLYYKPAVISNCISVLSLFSAFSHALTMV